MNIWYIFIFLFLIIAILCIYNFSSKKKYKNKNLLFTSAGDNTEFYKLWTGKEKNYDIWVVYYDDNNSIYNKYKSYCNKIWKRKGSKFQNFNYIYKNYYKELMKYDNFFIIDDDILINTSDINKLFNYIKQYDLLICQPSLKIDSKVSHTITLSQDDNILRFTNFIEVNAPLFSKEALNNFMKYYDDILIGWGIDYLYIWANGKHHKNKYAIIDNVSCINPKDVLKNNKRELEKIKNYKLRRDYWVKIAKKYDIPINWEHEIYDVIYKI